MFIRLFNVYIDSTLPNEIKTSFDHWMIIIFLILFCFAMTTFAIEHLTVFWEAKNKNKQNEKNKKCLHRWMSHFPSSKWVKMTKRKTLLSQLVQCDFGMKVKIVEMLRNENVTNYTRKLSDLLLFVHANMPFSTTFSIFFCSLRKIVTNRLCKWQEML